MTQPNTVHLTFDTSLVDLNPNASFSTTESDPSDLGTANFTAKTPTIRQTTLFDHHCQTPKQSQSTTPVHHIGTQEAYDQWATVYDSDGNMLQAVDDMELATLLPHFLSQVRDSVNTPVISFLDLGCGTGRNTKKLLEFALPPNRRSTVVGLDFSRGMLDLAAQKLQAYSNGLDSPRLRLEQSDCFPTVNNPTAPPFPSVPDLTPVNAVISTLVLEHVPIAAYFSTLSTLLHPGGLALITNMHSDMGAKSQAGFLNQDGIKIRGSSFAHTVQDSIDEAMKAGFEVLGSKEREISMEDMEGGAVGEREYKWLGTKVWFALVLRKMV